MNLLKDINDLIKWICRREPVEISNAQLGYHIDKLLFVKLYKIMTKRICTFCNLYVYVVIHVSLTTLLHFVSNKIFLKRKDSRFSTFTLFFLLFEWGDSHFCTGPCKLCSWACFPLSKFCCCCSQFFLFLFTPDLFFFYCLESTVVSISPHTTPPHHTHPLPTFNPTPFGFLHVSLIHVLWGSFPLFPRNRLPPSLCLLSVSYLFKCLWLCFACLFLLLIWLHL